MSRLVRLRRLRWQRRRLALTVASLPALWIVASDVGRRGHRIFALDRMHRLGWAATAVASLVFWGVLLYAASARRGPARHALAALFVALYALAAGVQGAFWRLFGAYDSLDTVVHLRSLAKGVLAELPLYRPAVVAQLASALGLAVAFVRLGRGLVRPHRLPRRIVQSLSAAALAGMAFVPASYRVIQATTPDVLYFHGFVGLFKQRRGLVNWDPLLLPKRRHPEAVPKLAPRPERPRNVLFILQESQRFDVTCTAYDPSCPLATPASNAAVPQRIPFLQLRANDTATALSLVVLWSGMVPNASERAITTAPLLWDYAHAAGYDTAYWTSQNLLFDNVRLFVEDIPVSHFAGATNIDPMADWDTGCRDAALSDRVIREWPELKEPFFAVVQYSNQHMPYVADAAHAPFRPFEANGPIERKRYPLVFYKNVVYLSDLAVAKLIEHVRRSPSGARTVIVFTADHGEHVGDRRAWGHTWGLYEPQLHVPGWIDAPPGTLAPSEEQSLRDASPQPLFHLDLAPTLLDLLGLWDAPELAPFRARMPGHPLTRPERTTGIVPLTNCSPFWECRTPNWGTMRGTIKLEKPPAEGRYRCYDVVADPAERAPLPDDDPRCGELEAEAQRLFPDPATAKRPYLPLAAEGVP